MLIAALAGTSIQIPKAMAGEMTVPLLPKPGVMVNLSPIYEPAHLQGIIIHPDNALQFDFLIQRGDGQLSASQKKIEYGKLIKYFLASLTIPDEDQWVNLSPYEHNRIIQDDFGKTQMGRDLLTQDYFLKQITSSLIYPQSAPGKEFWDRVYTKARQQFGSTSIPVNTFNKVWITPDDAVVYESGNTAYIMKSHLKVMMEEDYLSLKKHTLGKVSDTSSNVHRLGSEIIKQIVLPELEKEVNEGKNFAMLRQIYSSMVLATWYKKALRESLLGKVYADKAKVIGVDQDPKNNEAIYHRYLSAFKKGVFNFVREDMDAYSHEMIPRKYFAGGFARQGVVITQNVGAAMLGGIIKAASRTEDDAMVNMDPEQGQVSRRTVLRNAFWKAPLVAGGLAALRLHGQTPTASTAVPKPDAIMAFKPWVMPAEQINPRMNYYIDYMRNKRKFNYTPSSKDGELILNINGAVTAIPNVMQIASFGITIPQIKQYGRALYIASDNGTPQPDIYKADEQGVVKVSSVLKQIEFYLGLDEAANQKEETQKKEEFDKGLREIDRNNRAAWISFFDDFCLDAMFTMNGAPRSSYDQSVGLLKYMLDKNDDFIRQEMQRVITERNWIAEVRIRNNRLILRKIGKMIWDEATNRNRDLARLERYIGFLVDVLLDLSDKAKLPSVVQQEALDILRVLADTQKDLGPALAGQLNGAITKLAASRAMTVDTGLRHAVRDLLSQEDVHLAVAYDNILVLPYGFEINDALFQLPKDLNITPEQKNSQFLRNMLVRQLLLKEFEPHGWRILPQVITGELDMDPTLKYPATVRVRFVLFTKEQMLNYLGEQFGLMAKLVKPPTPAPAYYSINDNILGNFLRETIGLPQVTPKALEQLAGAIQKAIEPGPDFPRVKMEELSDDLLIKKIVDPSSGNSAMKVTQAMRDFTTHLGILYRASAIRFETPREIKVWAAAFERRIREARNAADLLIWLPYELGEVLDPMYLNQADLIQQATLSYRKLQRALEETMAHRFSEHGKASAAMASYKKVKAIFEKDSGPFDITWRSRDRVFTIRHTKVSLVRAVGSAFMTDVGRLIFYQDLIRIARPGSVESLWEEKIHRNKAMTIVPSLANAGVKGGIDLNSANLNLLIKRDGRGVPLPLAQQDMAQLSRVRGFQPDIIEIRPVTSALILSELQQNSSSAS